MGKDTSRTVNPRSAGPKKTTWPLDPHTRAKHEILRRYLGAWFPIMSQQNGRLIYFDGFAGPGIYDGGEPGSPILAIRTLIEHRAFDQFSKDTSYTFLFCEPDKKRYESLIERLNAFKESIGGKWPTQIRVVVADKPFDSTATEILDRMDAEGARLAPTFAFVDPFGISGLPIGLLSRLTTSPKCEIFVNMIMNTAKRFATSGIIDESLGDIYGTDEFKDAAGLSGRARIEFLHDLYAEQIKDECGFKYIQSFEMVNMQGHTSYYLFYASRHIAGLRAMKESMWKADPGGGYKFSDRLAGQDVLFVESELDTTPLTKTLIEVFAGTTVSIDELEVYVLEHTPYRETHLRKPVLRPLEEAGKITVVSNRKRRLTYPAGTKITFPPK